ncbi:MAG: PDZ domain-containing protein [Planctomycetota bacterium]
MKTCSKIKQFIPLAISQDLTETQQVLLNQHLPHCLDCRTELSSYREFREKMMDAGAVTESDTFWNNYTEEVMTLIGRENITAPTSQLNKQYLPLQFIRVAAVFLIGLTLGYSTYLILLKKPEPANQSFKKDMISSYQTEKLIENNILGVKFTPVSPALSEHLQITPNYGLVITDFLEQSPAKEMGIQFGDIMVELNGQPITNTGIFTYLNEVKKETFELKIIRKGETIVIKINLGGR